MTKFEGFPSGGRVQYTAVPNAFFSGLLPQITDVTELKTILYVMASLYTKKGSPRYVAVSELLENSALMQGIDNSEEKLRGALKLAVDHGALVSVTTEGEEKPQDIYFLNDEPNRHVVEKIKSGELKLAGLKAAKAIPVAAEPLPDIFTLYEQNIGILTPMISEELRDAESRYPAGWIHDAIKEAVLHNKRNIRYITKILENWSVEGRSDGTYQRDTKEKGPQKYFKGKYGHAVRH